MWYLRVWLLAPVLWYLSTLAACVEDRGKCCHGVRECGGAGRIGGRKAVLVVVVFVVDVRVPLTANCCLLFYIIHTNLDDGN